MRKLKGFTLIELMIVVAIVAILLAMMIPAYQQYVRQHNPEMGTQGGTLPEAKSTYLVCKDAAGNETRRIPSIPGASWSFEGGVFVTTDAAGNPVTQPASFESGVIVTTDAAGNPVTQPAHGEACSVEM